jgi:predicted transcriptional regulator
MHHRASALGSTLVAPPGGVKLITTDVADPADFLEVITPARVRLLPEISVEPVTLSVLALALSRDPSAVRRDVALLESQCLVTTSKVSNSGHGKRTMVKRVATRIELAAVV